MQTMAADMHSNDTRQAKDAARSTVWASLLHGHAPPAHSERVGQ